MIWCPVEPYSVKLTYFKLKHRQGWNRGFTYLDFRPHDLEIIKEAVQIDIPTLRDISLITLVLKVVQSDALKNKYVFFLALFYLSTTKADVQGHLVPHLIT